MPDPAEALELELSSDERELLDRLADGVSRRRLTPAAVFFLESVKPLGFVSSQLLHFFRPIIEVIWQNPIQYDRLAKLLEKRGAIELLIRRLEARG